MVDFEAHHKSRGMQLTMGFAAIVEGLGIKMIGDSFEGFGERKDKLYFSLGLGGEGKDKDTGIPYVSINDEQYFNQSFKDKFDSFLGPWTSGRHKYFLLDPKWW